MKVKNLVLAGAAAASLTLGSLVQAQPMGECLSTDFIDFDGSIVDAAIATPDLSTLVDAVVAAGLDGALGELDDITVYAPTNAAFEALPGGLLEDALEDTDLLAAVLTYHVTPAIQDPRRFTQAISRNTLQGNKVFFHREGGRSRVNNAAIDCQGIRTDNGTVWIIDSVLIP
jgi:uncharacterized surface protein with fasciclin (FAS1) repeats